MQTPGNLQNTHTHIDTDRHSQRHATQHAKMLSTECHRDESYVAISCSQLQQFIWKAVIKAANVFFSHITVLVIQQIKEVEVLFAAHRASHNKFASHWKESDAKTPI